MLDTSSATIPSTNIDIIVTFRKFKPIKDILAMG